MFEIKKKEPLKLKIYDVEYQVKRPSLGAFESLQTQMKENAGESIKLTRDFLVSLGLPQEILLDLEVEDFNLLTEFVVSSSKKN